MDKIFINFGISNFSRRAPGIIPEEVTIDIPLSKEIISFRDYAKHCSTSFDENSVQFLIPHISTLQDYPSVALSEPRGRDDLMMVWIPERNEWIGLEYSSWLESSAWGDDHSASGPYRLEEFHGRKILEAYGMDSSKISSLEALVSSHDTLYSLMPKIRIPIICKKLRGQSDADMSIIIPLKGNFKDYISNIPEGEPRITEFGGYDESAPEPLRKFPAVQIGDFYMLWVEERKEWVGLKYYYLGSHFEGDLQGVEEDAETSGPYRLEENCAKLIKKAYGNPNIPLWDQLGINDNPYANPKTYDIPGVLHSSPNELFLNREGSDNYWW